MNNQKDPKFKIIPNNHIKMSNEDNNPKQQIDFAVGGQAVIEGVMMRSPNFITVAVRKNKGHIKMKEENFQSITARLKLFGMPFVRGVVNLFEMMVVGMRMLNYSAMESVDEEEDNEKPASLFEKIMIAGSFALSIVVAFALSLFLFKFLPLWITDYLSGVFSILNEQYILFNLMDGVLKTTFFIVYVALLGLAPSIQRVFEYHGAEHKSIYTYEKGLELTPENAKKQTRFHPRCGTSFILIVFLISIFVYTFVPRQEDFMMTFGIRVLFLPIIAGISYEVLKWSAKKQENALIKMLITPGLWFQRLTTKEPTDKQLEVALSALKQALDLEKEHHSKVPSTKNTESVTNTASTKNTESATNTASTKNTESATNNASTKNATNPNPDKNKPHTENNERENELIDVP